MIAALFLVGGVLLTGPAWSQETRTDKDSERAKETTRKGNSERPKSEASSEKGEGTAAAGDPIAGAAVELRDDNRDGKVDKGDLLTISGNDYEVLPNAAVTVEDGSGKRETFDKWNARITGGSLQIDVTGDPGTKLSTGDLKVAKSTGVRSAAKKQRNDGRGGDGNRHGHGGGGNHCQQSFDGMVQGGTHNDHSAAINQYQIQYCINIKKHTRKAGGGGNGGGGNSGIIFGNRFGTNASGDQYRNATDGTATGDATTADTTTGDSTTSSADSNGQDTSGNGASPLADPGGNSTDAGGTSTDAGGSNSGDGTSGSAGDGASNPDLQAPVSGPQGDVVREISTGGAPLPETGGVELDAQVILVLVFLLGAALLIGGVVFWRSRRGGGQ